MKFESLLDEFRAYVRSYREQLRFSRKTWIRLLVATLGCILSSSILGAVSLWSDIMVQAGVYSDWCQSDTALHDIRIGTTATSSDEKRPCLRQYLGVVTSLIGGNIYGNQCAAFMGNFFNRHGGRFCARSGSAFLITGWTVLYLLQLADDAGLRVAANGSLQVAVMFTAIGTNLISQAIFSFMILVNGMQGLLVLLSAAGSAGGAVTTVGLHALGSEIGLKAETLILIQAVIVIISTIVCTLCIPSEEELAERKSYAADAQDDAQKQQGKHSTFTQPRMNMQEGAPMQAINGSSVADQSAVQFSAINSTKSDVRFSRKSVGSMHRQTSGGSMHRQTSGTNGIEDRRSRSKSPFNGNAENRDSSHSNSPSNRHAERRDRSRSTTPSKRRISTRFGARRTGDGYGSDDSSLSRGPVTNGLHRSTVLTEKEEQEELPSVGCSKHCKDAFRMIRTHWFRHGFFLTNTALASASSALYQGLAAEYGALLFDDHASGIALAAVGSCSAVLVVSVLAPALSVLMNRIGLRRLYIIMTTLLLMCRALVKYDSWFAQIFVACSCAFNWGLQPVFLGTHLYAYAIESRLSPVLLLFGVVYVFFFQSAQATAIADFDSQHYRQDLHRIQAILAWGFDRSGVASILYTIFLSVTGVPQFPIIFPEEELCFCRAFACKNMGQVIKVLNLKSIKTCYDMITNMSDAKNLAHIIVRINEEHFMSKVSSLSFSDFADLVEQKAFAWQKRAKTKSNMPILGLMVPASQWKETLLQAFDLNDIKGRWNLSFLEKDIQEGTTTLVVDDKDPDKVIRYTDIVIVSISFQNYLLIETSVRHPSGERQTFRFPATKRKTSESVEDAAQRLVSWLGKNLTVQLDYSNPQVMVESSDSSNYPGLTTVYKKHFGRATIIDGPWEDLQLVGLPEAQPWSRQNVEGWLEARGWRKSKKPHFFYKWLTKEDIRQQKPTFKFHLQSKRRTVFLNEVAKARDQKASGKFTNLPIQEQTRNLLSRKYTLELTALIRKRDQAGLEAKLMMDDHWQLFEGFKAMSIWLGPKGLQRYHRSFIDLVPLERLASMMRVRNGLRRVVAQILLHDLMSKKRDMSLKLDAAGVKKSEHGAKQEPNKNSLLYSS